MNKKLIIIAIVVIILIITIITVLAFNKNNNNSTSNREFNYVIEESRLGEYISIGKDKFTVYYDDNVQYISREKGKDENGNEFILLEYDPEKFDEDTAWDYIDMLENYDDYYELETSTEESQLIAHAENTENVRMISVFWSEERAYIKCTVCKMSSIDLDRLGDYYEDFMDDEPKEIYYEEDLIDKEEEEEELDLTDEDELYEDEFDEDEFDEDEFDEDEFDEDEDNEYVE